MCRFLCCSVQSVISSKLHTKKQPFNWPAPEGDILAQPHWLELLLPELDSRCWGPSADICHRLVETREFPGTYITCDYYVCFSVVSNSYHFRKRAHLLLGESEICPFLPLIRIVILTLYAPTPSAVPFLCSPCLCSVSSNRQALLKPRCDWQKEVFLFDFWHFFSLLLYFSICGFHFCLYSLPFSSQPRSEPKSVEGHRSLWAFWKWCSFCLQRFLVS